MLAALEELGMTKKTSTPAPVLVTMFDAEHIPQYLSMGRQLRQAGIGAEVYPEAKNLGKQLKYADRKGFRVALIAGGDEFAAGQWQIRNLKDGQQTAVAEGTVTAAVTEILKSEAV
jgi:histidyl-tRNA synthetase